MREDLIERLRNFEGSDALGNGDFSLLHEAADALEAAREDAERYRWALNNSCWIRGEHAAYVAIPVAREADLSCVAMRDAAIAAAMAKEARND